MLVLPGLELRGPHRGRNDQLVRPSRGSGWAESRRTASHCLLWSSGSGAGSRVTSTASAFARSTRSSTRRMASSGMPLSGSVMATCVGMSSPSSRASRASSLMSASAALIGSALAWFQRSTRFGSISAKAHAHIPSGLIRAGSEHAMDLVCADAFLAGQHQVQDSIPHEQRLLGFLEDGSSLEREAIRRAVIFAALFALPMPRARLARVNTLVKVARGAYTSGPAPTVEVRATSLF